MDGGKRKAESLGWQVSSESRQSGTTLFDMGLDETKIRDSIVVAVTMLLQGGGKVTVKFI